MEDNTQVTEEIIEGIDDFIPMPGADAVVTGSEETSAAEEKKNADIFKREKKVDMSFLDKDLDEKKEEEEDDENLSDEEKAAKLAAKANEDSTGAADEAIASIDEEFEDEPEVKTTKGEKNMLTAFQGLIDDEVILPFDDDKDLSEYTKKDWQELIKVNMEEREKAIREQTPKEFFDALPQELQYAAMHVAKGNTDLKSVFAALAKREQYLQATGFGSGDDALIEDQIQEWVETGNISKKANQFKPKLDKMQEKILEQDLARQEAAQQKQAEQKEAYMKNIYETLKPADLNGVKLDNKRQNMLWNELTTVKYESMTGRPTNLLGKLLEDYQFGDEPRYDLIAEATWLLSDPEDYKAQLRQSAKNEEVGETVKKLKTEEGRRLKSTASKEEKQEASRKPTKRTVSRNNKNIFARK
jgi:hypothetical protein